MSIFQIVGLFFGCAWVWIIYEWWRAPMLKEMEDGSFKTLRPAKKLSDLFKSKK